MLKTKNIVLTGLCIALGVVLPMTVHWFPNAGSVLLPMHIPVLLCGLICGWPYGLIAGLLTPSISSLLTGMPPAAYLPSMVCELAVYGLIAGLCIKIIPAVKNVLHIYGSLVAAMIAGRIVYGLVNAMIFHAGAYSMQIWLTASFVTALPGIVIQLIVIPAVILTLQKARVITPAAAHAS